MLRLEPSKPPCAAPRSADAHLAKQQDDRQTTGTISIANESAKALGIRVGMSTREAATLMLAAANASHQP